MENLIGKTLGQYQIIELIGRGGMAAVYKAYQPSLSRYVALKVLPDALAQDPQFVERFRREALAAAALRHPNIVVIHDVGQQSGFHYIAMEYLEGQTLLTVIQQTGGLPLPRIINIFNQIASALEYAHRRGLIHRDIKPSNIFIGPGDHVTLMDFGIVKAMFGAGLTSTGAMIGTPEYMSPEQIEGRTLDQRSDLYSLGVVLYQMLTGRVPFTGDSPTAIINGHLHLPPTPPSRLTAFVTPQVEAVVLRALAKNPQERFGSAQEMAWALAQAASGQAVIGAPIQRAAPTRSIVPLIALLIGLGGLMLITLIVVALAVMGAFKSGIGGVRTAGAHTLTVQPVVLATAAPTFTLRPTHTPAPDAPTSTPTPKPTQTPTPTAPPASPTASPTRVQAPTQTPKPLLTSTPTTAAEPRTVTLVSPANGATLRSSVVTFKWTGGALKSGEYFQVDVIPYQVQKGDCTTDYGPAGHQYSPLLTTHEWTTDIKANRGPAFYIPCPGRIEWVVYIKDASGKIIQETPRNYFVWNPLS